jgi:hypothetical protein
VQFLSMIFDFFLRNHMIFDLVAFFWTVTKIRSVFWTVTKIRSDMDKVYSFCACWRVGSAAQVVKIVEMILIDSAGSGRRPPACIITPAKPSRILWVIKKCRQAPAEGIIRACRGCRLACRRLQTGPPACLNRMSNGRQNIY